VKAWSCGSVAALAAGLRPFARFAASRRVGHDEKAVAIEALKAREPEEVLAGRKIRRQFKRLRAITRVIDAPACAEISRRVRHLHPMVHATQGSNINRL
jgi:hypothetical protein